LAGWLNERNLRPADLLDTEALDWQAIAETEIEVARLRALLQRGTLVALSVEKWLRSGMWVLSRADEAYPSRLKKRFGSKAPVLLYGAGDPGLLEHGGLAIVGSRNAGASDLSFARAVAATCASDRIAVLSGGARGVDAAAMQGASKAGGEVIGVLADGLLASVRRSEQRVGIEEGRLVLVSPYQPEAGFEVGHAMARNRYIYALADHALVVHSELNKGGTWAGAVENLKNGWVPVFARRVPEAVGNEALIKAGARAFEYVPEEHQDLRRYLEKGVVTARVDRAPEGPKMEVPVAKEASTDYGHAPASDTAPDSPIGLDLYSEFLRRLPVVTKGRAVTQSEIAKALGLQPSQAKTWAARAEEEGVLERKGRQKKYRLAEKRLF
jgi:predicted Rossmann fold nucleotide-binding protein DprA/Smf involved in DNA uptake